MYDKRTFKRKIDYIKYNFSFIFQQFKSKEIFCLEIGPGMGEFITHLNNIGVNNIDIVDNDKGILDYAKKKFKIKNSIVNHNINLTDSKLGKYNLIVMIQVLEHIPINQYKKIIQILYKHLKQNGYLVIVVPNANNPLGIVERYGDLQHYNSFTEQSLKDLLTYSHIENYEIDIKGYEIPPYSIINIVRIFFQKLLHILLLLLLIVNGGIFFKTMTPNIMLTIRRTTKTI